jgi:hypothetical protein
MLPKNKRKLYSILICLLMSVCITANFSACNKDNKNNDENSTPTANPITATTTITTAPKSPETTPATDVTTANTSENADPTPAETAPPSTQPPATAPPATAPPATQPPATAPPATAPPATQPPATQPPATEPPAPKDTDAENIQNLFNTQQSDVWVHGKGTVTRVLADDTDGDKHQKFILKLSTGQTLLVAHNIDIAPRIADIQVGDTISFYGEYIYSDKGGTLHWTHHDPDGSSEGGYLEKNSVFFK